MTDADTRAAKREARWAEQDARDAEIVARGKVVAAATGLAKTTPGPLGPALAALFDGVRGYMAPDGHMSWPVVGSNSDLIVALAQAVIDTHEISAVDALAPTAALSLIDELLTPWNTGRRVHPGREAVEAGFIDRSKVDDWNARRAALSCAAGPSSVGSSGPARSAGEQAACPIPIPDPGGTAEPSAANPWRVTLCWTPTQNHGVVSAWPSRAPVTAIAGLLRAGETGDEVAAEHGLSAVEVTVLRHLVDDLDQTRREAPLYEHTARAIQAALESADMELAIYHGGQPVRLYSLARCLDKAGLIDWTNVPDRWDDNTTAPVDVPDGEATTDV